ncbi:hypothetical protein ACQZV8_19520, partial [Magnetococcales bacterium HHB-1]
GDLFWPGETQYLLERHKDRFCRALPQEPSRYPLTLYAADIHPDYPLMLELDDDPWLGLSWLLTFLRLLTVVVIGWLLIQVSWRGLILPACSLGVAGIIGVIYAPHFLSGMGIMEGANDGLSYYSFGREIMQHALAGDWYSALRGEENLFYSMPAMRYLWALSFPIFGSSFFGLLLVLVFFPLLILRLVREFCPPNWVTPLMVIYLAIPLLESFGFFHLHFAKTCFRGYGGVFGYPLLYLGLILSIAIFKGRPMSRGGYAIIGLLFALALGLRPNWSPFVGVLLLAISFVTWQNRLPWHFFLLCLGFSPLLLLPWHNYYYGGILALFNDPKTIAYNLVATPMDYVRALMSLFSMTPERMDSVSRVLLVLDNWIAWYKVWRMVAYAALWHALLKRGVPFYLKMVSMALLANHAAFLFFLGGVRYANAIWTPTLLVFFAMWHLYYHDWFEGRFKNRFKNSVARVSFWSR